MKLLRFLLFPFALIYDAITSIRNWFFDIGVLKSTSFDTPVIAVGNLSVGGTGKTPQIEYLIRLLQNDYKVAVLSRGYKRKTNGFMLLNNSHTAEDVGDEPLQFFKKFVNIQVAVDANRTNGIQQLLQRDNPPEVVLLDDAFQHRKVKAGFYILLTKYNDLYVDDFILPTGNLRESRRGANRANVIVVTKCPQNLAKEEQVKIIKKLRPNSNQQVFFTSISYDEHLLGASEIPVKELKNYQVLLVTGIANPKPLLNYLADLQVDFEHLNYPDHHHFSDKDIQSIQSKFKAIPTENKLIVTTEKDFVRLEKDLKNVSYLPISTCFLEGKIVFDSTIKKSIQS